MEKTIAAVATPLGAGGIGVVRVSGKNAVEICEKAVSPTNGKRLSEMKGYTAAHCKIYFEGEAIDEGVVLVFKAPKSYTGEDVVEISCHGGNLVTNKVLRSVLSLGADIAEPGEFSKRAFLNGKIDLSKAEGIMALISAKGDSAMRAGYTALDGALSREMDELSSVLISASANFAAWVDYPDDDIPELSDFELQKAFDFVIERLQRLLSKFDAGKAITDAVETAIVGKPNVGKSALMNLLSGYDRSIVTDLAGTTRDIVEETVRVGSIALRLADTAGIRESDDVVESIGVEMAKTKIERADLVLMVFDSSRELSREDEEIMTLLKGRRSIAVINKIDLQEKIDEKKIEAIFSERVYISAKTRQGEAELQRAIERVLGTDEIDTSKAMLTTERQRKNALEALKILEEGKQALLNGMTLDAVNVSIDSAIDSLLRLSGKRAGQAVVDEVFSQFCVGK